ncbi:MAG: pitrilysin family protein [Candidatus Eisenbacteria bacterium]
MRNPTTGPRLLLLLLPLLSIVLSGGAARAAEPTIAILRNGLEVVLIENRSSPMIAATMVVRAGADLETAGTSGASHMMEHLLFNGTERRTQKELYDETDLYGIYNNATTRRTHTDYFVLVSKDRIREAMDIQEDMLFHSAFPIEKLEKERGIVLEELGKDEQDPGHIADQLFRTIAFAGTPYARPILGTRKSIAALSRDDIVAYWRATYVPSNMTLFAMGDFDADSLLPAIDSIYGAAPARPHPPQGGGAFPQLPDGGPIRAFHGKTEKGFLFLALPPPDRDPNKPINDVLAPYVGRRLHEDLAEGEDPIVFSIDAWYDQRAFLRASPWNPVTGMIFWDRNRGRLLLSATFDPARTPEEVEEAILASLARIAETEPDPEEIERFRVSTKTSDVYLSEKPHMYGMMKAEEIARDGYGGIERVATTVDAFNGSALRERADWFKAEKRLAVAFMPGEPDYTDADLETTIPGEKAIWERVGGDDEAALPPLAFRVLRFPGKDSAGRAPRSERADTTLANGLRIVAVSNDDSEVFAIHLLAKHRSWQEPAGLEGIADCLHRLLLKGTEKDDGPSLRARLERIGAEVKTCDASFIPYDDYYTTPSYSFVRFTTIDDFAEEGMDLFADMIRRPQLGETDLAAVKQEMTALARGRRSKPSGHSELLLAQTLYIDNPLASDPEGNEESIAAITRDDLARFHETYFAPDNLILTAVTSLPAAEVARAIALRFEDAAAHTKRKPAPPDPRPTERSVRIEETLGGTQGTIRIAYVIPVPREDHAALTLATAILSDAIAFDLRETRGLAYGVGGGVSVRGGAATISASIGTSPENFEEAEKGIREHFEGFRAIETIEPRELERSVNAILGRMNMRRLSRPNQAYREGLALFTGEGEDWIDRIRSVTAEEVVRAARSYIRSSPSATVLVR